MPQDPPGGNVWQSLYRQGKEGLREVGQLVLGWCELKHPCDLIRSGRFRVQNRPQSGSPRRAGISSPTPNSTYWNRSKEIQTLCWSTWQTPSCHYTTSISSSAWNSRRLEQVGNSGIPQVPLPHFPNEDEEMGGTTLGLHGL